MRFKVVLLLLLLTPAFAKLEWWNTSWDYRTCLQVNSTQYSREEWPVEFELNLTADFLASGGSGTINESSLRLVEQDASTGASLYTLPFQFDKNSTFNATTNFHGTLAFILNGTTPAYTLRKFCLYYDNDTKPAVSYAGIPYSWDGEEFQINISIMDGGTEKGLEYWLDTKRGANVSGIYRVRDFAGNEFWGIPSQSELPMEYVQYSNGTHNFTFDFRNNLTVKYAGPVRVVVEQQGPEVLWNSSTQTGAGWMTKRYIFYNQSQWFKVEQVYENRGGTDVSRQSTPAGALAWEVAKMLFNSIILGSGSDPGSYYWFAAEFANFHLGVINVQESVSNFVAADRNLTAGRGGIELSSLTVAAGSAIRELAAIHFNSPSAIRGSPTDAQVRNLKDRLINPENTTKILAEKWEVQINASTDHPFYNRGENVTLLVNATRNSGVIALVNGTLESADGTYSIVLYDDGTHGDSTAGDGLYTYLFTLNDTNATGLWNFTAYAWDKSSLPVGTSAANFTVTSTYSANLTVINWYGFVSREVNATMTVMNYRNDTYIPGASIGCEYNSTGVPTTVTDHGNGTYSIRFTAPSYYGIFFLICNATRYNNTGTAGDFFEAIEYVTEVVTELNFTDGVPDNVTLSSGQNLTMRARTTDLGNGTAYDINLTLFLPSGWSSNSTEETLPNMNVSDYADRYFLLSIPANETPGNYTINATVEWMNSDSSYDNFTFIFNVTVHENPVLSVPETNLSATVKPGDWNYMGNITVESLGNFRLINVTFNVTGLDTMQFNFTPPNISSLFQGKNRSVEVWVYLPSDHQRGTFQGVLNVSAGNDGYDTVNLTVEIIETYMNVTAEPSSISADNVSWYYFQNFTVVVNSTNIGGSTGIATNMTLVLPEAYWLTNVTNNTYSCGDIAPGGHCTQVFEIAVKRSTPGDYNVTVNVTWDNPGVGVTFNTTTITVTVTSNPSLGVDELEVNGTVHQGATTEVGNYTLRNLGNAQVDGVSTTVTGLSDFTVTFSPVVNFVPVGEVINISISVQVPAGYSPGNYSGTVNVTSSNGGYDFFTLNIEVPENRSWTMAPQNCTAETAFDEGKVCDVVVSNRGNAPVNITILPYDVNYTYANETNFTVQKQSNYTFSIWWNLTGVKRDYYNSTFNVTSTGVPLWRFLNITLIPRELAEINATLTKNITAPGENITVYANVTDKSLTGIGLARLVVFRPDGRVESRDLVLDSTVNNTYYYHIDYPSSWATTNAHGNYTLSIEVRDNLGLYSRKNLTMYVYPVPAPVASTKLSTYFLGETLTLYANSTDLGGLSVRGNLSVRIYDSEGYLRYSGDYEDVEGLVEPLITYTIPDDAPVGNYTVLLNATVYDGVSGKTTTGNSTYIFRVTEFFKVDFDTSFIWYPDNTLNFYVLAYSDSPFNDPDRINLTVYDPAQNLFFTTESFSTVHSDGTSKLYVYRYALPANAAIGDYLAVLTLNQEGRTVKRLKSFRLSYGGPFDVVITSLEPEVPRGTYQNFTVLLENMGDLSQDVFLSYWISRGNTTYDRVTGEAIYVPAGGNRTLNRSLFVYSSQPAGNYTLHVLLNYSPLNPPIETTRTFLVVSGNVTNVTAPEKPEVIAPVEAAVIELTITNIFPEQLVVNRGSTGYVTIEVKNTGDVPLTDITVFFDDVEPGWYKVNNGISSLEPGETGYMVVAFKIPSDANARTYVSKMRIVSKETEVSEYYKIIVFKTQEDALRAKISILRDRLLDLEGEAGSLAAKGIDVTYILSQIKRSRELLDVAETFLDEDRTVDAINTISEVESIIEQIKYRIQVSKPRVLPPVTVPRVPPSWYIWLAWLVSAAVLGYVLYRKYVRRRKRSAKQAVSRLKSLMEKKESTREGSDLSELLRKQYEEGLLSRETFEELKSLLR